MNKNFYLILLIGAFLALFEAQPTLADPEPGRPLGDSSVLSSVPAPGYPEGIAVRKGLVYTSGPAAFVPGTGDPKIFAFDINTGNLVKTITVLNQQLPYQTLSCITFGKKDDLYAVGLQNIIKINLKTGEQSVYAAPFYPVYHSANSPPAPFLLNDLAFDDKGFLYVTDSFQATIWRVPPGGGAPEVWFQDARLDGIYGANGIRINPKDKRLYVSVTWDNFLSFRGYVYSLPLTKAGEAPTWADLRLEHTYKPSFPPPNGASLPAQGPDGIAFGKSGKLYVALAGFSQISVLMPDGTQEGRYGIEEVRYFGPAGNPGDLANPLPWSNPANIAFNDKSGALLVTNHASIVPFDPGLFKVFDVYVNDKAGKLFEGGGDD